MLKMYFPLQDPGWYPNDDEELGRLKRYRELIVKGLERAIPKTINWSALYAIKQGPSQTPSEFLDHLRDTMRQHTTLDPGSDEGTQQLLNLFLGQSTGDIRRKLQKIRGPNSQNLETLLDEAWRGFSNREEGYKQGMKKLVAVVKEGEKGKRGQGPPKQGPPRLGKINVHFGYKNSPTIFGGRWLSPQRFLKYQAILVEQDDVEIVVTNIVNPASFLSGSMGEPVIHDCLETIEATYSSRPDLKDTLLEDAETWFTDGSSYVVSGRRQAGYAVTTSKEVIESGPLPTNTSAQKAEIIALIRALELAKGKEINIYTDSRYAFGVVHAHGAIWRERGLLNSQSKSIKHAQEILRLLDAIQLPEKVAIMHIKAHQKVSSELEEGNMLADREAKEAAKGEVPDKAVEAALIPDGKVSMEGKPVYNKKDKKLSKVCTEYPKNQTKITPPVPRKAVITKMPAIPEVEEQITPVVTKIGPYAIKKTGVQKLIVNPKWSLKQVEMGVQVLLMTEAAIRTKEREWIHASRIKGPVEEPKEAQLAQTLPLDFAVHNIQPGDWVLGKEWKEAPLVAKWHGPFQVLLTTETAVKTAEHGWTHHTRVKVSEAPEIWASQLEEKDGKPRLTLCRSGLEQ
ncbi:hypothetical protein DUI87_03203 [Hirundo rustica rustica]|uniref:RNase H type-1 domain-containing protein n=1 Tax=Hirundo rustica rustica TaxID=333673 RepID=A0A3M0L241_HIRRU|nr:hypothetical protein DUI87_03203 [Hirundo rustica rustica]